VASGLRLGANILAQRGMGPDVMPACAELVATVLAATEPLSDTDYRLDPDVRKAVLDEVADLCRCFPIPGYPRAAL
jgi:glycine hydroxymethyltransferase